MRYEEDNNRPKPDVSIVILNWNTSKLLEQCLTSIIKNTNDISYEVIAIDNNSTGSGFKKVKQRFSEYTNFIWIENEKNIGGLADNQALPYCWGRYLLLLGPDTIVLPQSFKRMVDFLDNNKEAGAVAAYLINPPEMIQQPYRKLPDMAIFLFCMTKFGRLVDRFFLNKWFSRRYICYIREESDPTKGVVIDQAGPVIMVKREIIDTSGRLIDDRFPFYFNDVDLCKRIKDKGYKLFALYGAKIIHFKSSSFKKAESSWKAKEYYSGLLEYFHKHRIANIKFIKVIICLDNLFLLLVSFVLIPFKRDINKPKEYFDRLKFIWEYKFIEVKSDS